MPPSVASFCQEGSSLQGGRPTWCSALGGAGEDSFPGGQAWLLPSCQAADSGGERKLPLPSLELTCPWMLLSVQATRRGRIRLFPGGALSLGCCSFQVGVMEEFRVPPGTKSCLFPLAFLSCLLRTSCQLPSSSPVLLNWTSSGECSTCLQKQLLSMVVGRKPG